MVIVNSFDVTINQCHSQYLIVLNMCAYLCITKRTHTWHKTDTSTIMLVSSTKLHQHNNRHVKWEKLHMLNILILKKGMWAFARVAACLLAAAAHFHLNPVRTLIAPHYA